MRDLRDIVGGGLLLAFGAVGLAIASSYDLGTARRMGPGAYPVLVSGALVLASLAILVPALSRQPNASVAIAFRPAFAVLGSLVAFAVLMPAFGLLPAVAMAVVLASMGSDQSKSAHVALLATGIAIACWLVFVVGLKRPLPVFRLPL